MKGCDQSCRSTTLVRGDLDSNAKPPTPRLAPEDVRFQEDPGVVRDHGTVMSKPAGTRTDAFWAFANSPC
jgi:hypothetical protein